MIAPPKQPNQTKNQRKLEQLLTRATKDEAFRQELLTNPKPLLEHELGITLPPSVIIQVHDTATTGTVHLVLPPRQQRAEEVWDADLEASAHDLLSAALLIAQPVNRKLHQQLLARATKDEAFRQELLTNPRPLLERELGITLPPTWIIQVHDTATTGTTGTVHLVLPPRQQRAEEVWDADLEWSASEGISIVCRTALWTKNRRILSCESISRAYDVHCTCV